MKVLFIGANPALEGTGKPFEGCRSGEVLQEWLSYMMLSNDDVELDNVVGYKTPGNRALKASEISSVMTNLKKRLKNRCVVALGNVALKACTKAGTADLLLSLPHPSPKNRMLNDERDVKIRLMYVAVKLQEYLNE